MGEESDHHSACVDAWLARSARDLPAGPLLRLFEQGFGVLWLRAHRTLGDVTLTAIVDRVLYTAAERYPQLPAMEIEATGIRCREGSEALDRALLAQGARFVLVEFLTVLGNLTADILTPALHAELSKVAPEARDIEAKPSHNLQNVEHKREGAKS